MEDLTFVHHTNTNTLKRSSQECNICRSLYDDVCRALNVGDLPASMPLQSMAFLSIALEISPAGGIYRLGFKVQTGKIMRERVFILKEIGLSFPFPNHHDLPYSHSRF